VKAVDKEEERMTRNLKALGLALVAMLALGAMSAASASATDRVTTEENTGEGITAVRGELNRFEITGGPEVVCETANFAGTVDNGDTTGTFVPEYSGEPGEGAPHVDCTSSAGPALVDMNECAYILSGNTVEGDAEVWVECGDEPIEIDVTGLLTLSIPEQTPTEGGVAYTNNTPGAGEVTIDATVQGITYSCAPHFICTLGGIQTEGNNADYEGTVVASGANGPISFSEE
jgi:hypothetical protein